MTLDYYRIFYYVAQYQSFSKAAEILGNNQPNLSRCMNLLESELGCKLLVRTNRGVSLTPEGQRLFEHVAIAMCACRFPTIPHRRPSVPCRTAPSIFPW